MMKNSKIGGDRVVVDYVSLNCHATQCNAMQCYSMRLDTKIPKYVRHIGRGLMVRQNVRKDTQDHERQLAVLETYRNQATPSTSREALHLPAQRAQKARKERPHPLHSATAYVVLLAALAGNLPATTTTNVGLQIRDEEGNPVGNDAHTALLLLRSSSGTHGRCRRRLVHHTRWEV
jgi:hypothetical protein